MAQTFDIKKISTNEGLPAGQIGDVITDENGFIWLSTFEGLVRYNGTETHIYNSEHGLRNKLVYDLFLDSKERFWVTFQEAGAGVFEGDTMRYLPELSALDSLSIIHISESEDGRLWFSTYGNGVFIWDDENLVQLTEEDGLPSNYTWNFYHEKSGKTWIGTWSGVAVFDRNFIKEKAPEIKLSGLSVYNFSKDQSGKLWASTSNGVSVFDGNGWEQISSVQGKNLGYVYFVLADKSGTVWIGTEGNGIYFYENGEYTHINKSNGLSSNYIYSLYEDDKGRIWVATDENGVNIIRSKGFRIFEDSDFVLGESVNMIFENEAGLWLGTELGITKFSEEGGSEHFQLPENMVQYKEVWDIDQLPNGNLLIQNSNSQLLEFDGRDFSNYGEKIGLNGVSFHDILVDGGRLWIATESRLWLYENGDFKTYTIEQGLKDPFVWSLFKDMEGQIWATTDQGISKIVGDSAHTFSFEDGINGSAMHFITQSADGHYWVGTDAGFSKLLIAGTGAIQSVYNYTLPDEFLSETQFLEFDENGNIWQGTSGGLHYHKVKELPEENNNLVNGLFFPLQDYGKGLEMNYLASLKDSNGDFWFGSYTHGLIKYEAGAEVRSHEAPRSFIQELRVNGRSGDYEPNEDDILEFDHDQNNITFKIGSLFYENPERVFFQLRLKGFEDSWQLRYGQPEISYTNLEPGDYELEVRTKSIQSDWGEPVKLATFQVDKPFWNTAWFYLLAVLGIAGLMYLIIRIILEHHEKQKLGRMVRERTAELQTALEEKEVLIKEIHHRVKNNMAVVSGLLELQGWKIKDKEAKAAIENSKLRLQTMSAIHERLYRSETLTDIDFKTFAEDLIQRISGSLNSENKDIQLNLDIRPGSLSLNTAIPCGLILNELISNCYEHAFENRAAGKIWVDFRPYVGNRYRLEVRDNGVGISEDIIIQKRSSLGITLIHSLTSQIKGEVEILNDEGTKVVITVPREE